MSDYPNFKIGQSVHHPELGDGVVIGIEPFKFVKVFFRTQGERMVPATTLEQSLTWEQQAIAGLRPGTPEAVEQLWLALEAAELPLMESAATLTSAKVDLLPHQVVLVHRIANASPRRFLIADEVGLGKTVETALVLRELASRGELTRALIVAPAGLVENWRRELNDVFHLDFEVFGSEGDVSDRKSNAFAKHNRLIASVDTLKRKARVKRLLEAPRWDLVVFDEAHHLNAYKSGKKVNKTENYKLAEAIREHCRDLLLLSATPHQGDHFRFWMLIRLLNPTLFEDAADMVENRHRLNAILIRRTKADACASDGSELFARRVVHTEEFTLSEQELRFYDALLNYLRDGYNLAEKQGQKGRALGFVMTIFQKIAASSFAAVRLTLQRRLLMLTLLQAIECDERLDVDGRDRAFNEARDLIHLIYSLGTDAVSRAEVDKIVADGKMQILKRRKSADPSATTLEIQDESEFTAATSEENAASMVAIALPEERRRILELLQRCPGERETKASFLVDALRQLWQVNPDEKVVIFATYLGSVDSIRDAIVQTFPGKGVDILKGGDHGAKTAAQRRFRRKDGPKVLICTAAGREGINLQFARILFNYDLPWNPMDLEQRIGRIHRYGQRDTAQVYNLVAKDTIEGSIYLLLEEKLQDIAKTLGKIDEQGQVTEDLRSQILGQLGSQLSYDHLYQEAVRDPSLKRTRQELEVAMSNANLARKVVFELFQDLEDFNLSDYKQFDDQGRGMRRLVSFTQRAAHLDGGRFNQRADSMYVLELPGQPSMRFTSARDVALQADEISLLGLEHPIIQSWLDKFSNLPAQNRAVRLASSEAPESGGILTIWQVVIQVAGGQLKQQVVRLGTTLDRERSTQLEHLGKDLLSLQVSETSEIDLKQIGSLVNGTTTEMLRRDLAHAGVLTQEASFSKRLIGLVVIVRKPNYTPTLIPNQQLTHL